MLSVNILGVLQRLGNRNKKENVWVMVVVGRVSFYFILLYFICLFLTVRDCNLGLRGEEKFPQTQRSLKISVGQYIDLDIIHTHTHI